MSEKNLADYKNAKTGLLEMLFRRKRPRVAPSKELIKACMKPKVLNFHDLDDLTESKPFRHQFKLQWTRVPIDSPTSAENNNEGSQTSKLHPGPLDYQESHEFEIDA